MMSPGQVLRIDPREMRRSSRIAVSPRCASRGSLPWDDLDSFKFDTSGSVDIVRGSFGDRVYVDRIEIGSARRWDSFDRIDIDFNANAAPVLVQRSCEATTYEYSRAPSAVRAQDGGHRSRRPRGEGGPHRRLLPVYATMPRPRDLAELGEGGGHAGPGMVVGTFAAQDPNDGDRMTWSLVDDARRRFQGELERGPRRGQRHLDSISRRAEHIASPFARPTAAACPSTGSSRFRSSTFWSGFPAHTGSGRRYPEGHERQERSPRSWRRRQAVRT